MDLTQIRSIKKKAETNLLKRSGVTGVGIGFKRVGGQKTDVIAIQVFVEHKRNVPARQLIPAVIQGIETDVIQGKMFAHCLQKPIAEITPSDDVKIYNPLIGGISIGPCRTVDSYVFAGTLGVVVNDNATGNPLLLSNYHIFVLNDVGAPGDQMTQPSRVDGGRCPDHIVGELVRGHFGDNVDCAVASSTHREVACEIAEIGVVNGITEAVLGMAVRKRGRTTGLTYGIVDSIDLSIKVDYGGFLATTVFRNQIGISVDETRNTKFGIPGDSGSVVVDSQNRIAGLYFAGDADGVYGIANPIGLVLEALDISICSQ